MIGLTAPQQRLLRFIAGYQAAHGGISPTMDECARGCGLKGRSAIQRQLELLEERGAVRRIRFHVRAIDVLAPVSIPSIDNAPLYAVPMRADGRGFHGERL
jgi:SOS-response transcriptional repressor LexA